MSPHGSPTLTRLSCRASERSGLLGGAAEVDRAAARPPSMSVVRPPSSERSSCRRRSAFSAICRSGGCLHVANFDVGPHPDTSPAAAREVAEGPRPYYALVGDHAGRAEGCRSRRRATSGVIVDVDTTRRAASCSITSAAADPGLILRPLGLTCRLLRGGRRTRKSPSRSTRWTASVPTMPCHWARWDDPPVCGTSWRQLSKRIFGPYVTATLDAQSRRLHQSIPARLTGGSARSVWRIGGEYGTRANLRPPFVRESRRPESCHDRPLCRVSGCIGVDHPPA